MYNLRNSSEPVMFMYNVPVDDTQYMQWEEVTGMSLFVLFFIYRHP